MPGRQLWLLPGQTKLRCRLYPRRPPLRNSGFAATHADAITTLRRAGSRSYSPLVQLAVEFERIILGTGTDPAVSTVSSQMCPNVSEAPVLVAFPLGISASAVPPSWSDPRS